MGARSPRDVHTADSIRRMSKLQRAARTPPPSSFLFLHLSGTLSLLLISTSPPHPPARSPPFLFLLPPPCPHRPLLLCETLGVFLLKILTFTALPCPPVQSFSLPIPPLRPLFVDSKGNPALFSL